MNDSPDVRAALERQERFAPDPGVVQARVLHPGKTLRWPALGAVAAAVVAVVVLVAVVRGHSSSSQVGDPPVSSGSMTRPPSSPAASSPSNPSDVSPNNSAVSSRLLRVSYVGVRWVLTSASIDGAAKIIPTSTGRPPQPVQPAVLELFPDGSSLLTGPACFEQYGRWRPSSGGFELVEQHRVFIPCYLVSDRTLDNAGDVFVALTGPLTASADSTQMTLSCAHVGAAFTAAGTAHRPGNMPPLASPSPSSSGR